MSLTILTTSETVERAIRGDTKARVALVALLTPVIHCRVGRVLAERRWKRGISSEHHDLVQECFASVFADDARVLRQWDPERGLSLVNWIGIVSQRRARDLVRRSEQLDFEALVSGETALLASVGSEAMEANVELKQTLSRLSSELSARGVQLFEHLWLADDDISTVARILNMNEKAVYAARGRLRERIRELLEPLALRASG